LALSVFVKQPRLSAQTVMKRNVNECVMRSPHCYLYRITYTLASSYSRNPL